VLCSQTMQVDLCTTAGYRVHLAAGLLVVTRPQHGDVAATRHAVWQRDQQGHLRRLWPATGLGSNDPLSSAVASSATTAETEVMLGPGLVARVSGTSLCSLQVGEVTATLSAAPTMSARLFESELRWSPAAVAVHNCLSLTPEAAELIVPNGHMRVALPSLHTVAVADNQRLQLSATLDDMPAAAVGEPDARFFVLSPDASAVELLTPVQYALDTAPAAGKQVRRVARWQVLFLSCWFVLDLILLIHLHSRPPHLMHARMHAFL
jgi:hypothetical protein